MVSALSSIARLNGATSRTPPSVATTCPSPAGSREGGMITGMAALAMISSWMFASADPPASSSPLPRMRIGATLLPYERRRPTCPRQTPTGDHSPGIKWVLVFPVLPATSRTLPVVDSPGPHAWGHPKEGGMRAAPFLILTVSLAATAGAGEAAHPDSLGWPALFAEDLSDAIAPEGVWSFEDGVLTASEDRCIWTRKAYGDFTVDLEFRTAAGTNSGVIVYCSDVEEWIPNSVEIQIADDYAEKWASSPATWRCGAFFGHKAAAKSAVKKPGEWNRMTVRGRGPIISVVLNGELVNEMDMRQWTSATTNPDGSEIPAWLSKPKADLPTRGHIGLQGKHAGAPIYFRNLRIEAAE
jgi:hypothetical protein